MMRYTLLTVFLAPAILAAFVKATSEIDNNEGDNFQSVRQPRKIFVLENKGGIKAEANLTKEAQDVLEIAAPSIKEKIKALTKADEIKGALEGIKFRYNSFQKQSSGLNKIIPEEFDLSNGRYFFIKVKAKVVTKDVEEDKYFHVRVYAAWYNLGQPTIVGIDTSNNGVKTIEDPIEPFGMFAEYQPDPSKRPVVTL